MKKRIALLCSFALLFGLSACSQTEHTRNESRQNETQSESQNESQTDTPSETSTETAEPTENLSEEIPQEEDSMQIRVESNGNTIVFELNDSQAARELYEQLPLSIEVEDYSTNEKIFYPPEELDVSDAPLAEAGAGTLAYYAPWGDVVMFYDEFGGAGGLYELGEVISGEEYISQLSGSIQVEQKEE